MTIQDTVENVSRAERLRILLGRAVLGLLGAALLFAPLVVAQGAITSANTGLNETARNAGYQTTNVSIPQFVGTVINAALGIIGVIFLVLIVYGGMLWMLSEGDETKIGSARGLIFHSIIGLILVLSAYAITSFVVGSIIKGTLN
ncbi:hypothetical protein HY623_03280 [Candidatus Uhrbacteria bacterium]|nr:hypothetical protein [Candidatus Uhrbacteria bacterium]